MRRSLAHLTGELNADRAWLTDERARLAATAAERIQRADELIAVSG